MLLHKIRIPHFQTLNDVNSYSSERAQFKHAIIPLPLSLPSLLDLLGCFWDCAFDLRLFHSQTLNRLEIITTNCLHLFIWEVPFPLAYYSLPRLHLWGEEACTPSWYDKDWGGPGPAWPWLPFFTLIHWLGLDLLCAYRNKSPSPSVLAESSPHMTDTASALMPYTAITPLPPRHRLDNNQPTTKTVVFHRLWWN